MEHNIIRLFSNLIVIVLILISAAVGFCFAILASSLGISGVFSGILGSSIGILFYFVILRKVTRLVCGG